MNLADKFKTGRAVKVKKHVKDHAEKIGRVRGVGVQLGYPVVEVKFEELSKAIAFAPEELLLV